MKHSINQIKITSTRIYFDDSIVHGDNRYYITSIYATSFLFVQGISNGLSTSSHPLQFKTIRAHLRSHLVTFQPAFYRYITRSLHMNMQPSKYIIGLKFSENTFHPMYPRFKKVSRWVHYKNNSRWRGANISSLASY